MKPTGRVREVAVTELRRGHGAVVDRVRKGEAAIIVKHGRPLAMLLPFADLERLRPIELGDADLEPFAPRSSAARTCAVRPSSAMAAG